MLRKLVHKFWSRVLGIPEPQPRIPRNKIGMKVRLLGELKQNKIDWKIGYRVTEEVDHHMGNLRTTSWWPAKWETFALINDEPDKAWEEW